jgi:hypothetical protein
MGGRGGIDEEGRVWVSVGSGAEGCETVQGKREQGEEGEDGEEIRKVGGDW